jgi:serine/threonine-protein kinase ATR
MAANSVTSLQSCHDSILRLHALTEMESIGNAGNQGHSSRSEVSDALSRRLDVLGGYLSDKQYLLGLRRATMELS